MNCPRCGGSLIGNRVGICDSCGFEVTIEDIRKYEKKQYEKRLE